MPPNHDEVRASAYVDGELDPYERAALLEELVRNPVRSREVAELAELKELVRLAFEDLPGAPRRAVSFRRARGRTALRCALGGALAAVLLIVSFGAGWVARGGDARAQAQIAALGGVRLAAPAPGDQVPGVLLHLASFDSKDVNVTLQRTRELLQRYQGSGLHVELVVNGMALQFLRANFFPYSDEFARLMRRYPNLHIVACGATLQALHDDGDTLKLLKGVNVTSSAVEEVVKRLREGWVYVNA